MKQLDIHKRKKEEHGNVLPFLGDLSNAATLKQSIFDKNPSLDKCSSSIGKLIILAG